MHVANQLCLTVALDPVDADVDHSGARFDIVASQHFRATHGGHQNISAPADRCQILGAAVRDGDGAAITQQQLRHRFADDIRPPDHNRIQPRQRPMMVAQHHQTTQRRARHHRLLPGAQQADVRDMKAIDILGRINRVDDQFRVQMRRQRQLHQNAMHFRIGVQRFHQRQQIGFCGIHRQTMFKRGHADLDGRGVLVAHIDLRRRVFADQHHRQTGLDAVFFLQLGDMRGHLRADIGSKGFAIDHFSGHLILLRQPPRRRCDNVPFASGSPKRRFSSAWQPLPARPHPAPG
ncbi:MAG: hypothetical protein ACD_54C00063G0003 [uncultured bacterium]|nr:MAG: hypothetical protein ACD_54C00063G0003 [uncultured bacterium]